MNITSLDDEWMTEAQTAAEVHKTVRTLRQWRKRRVGPPYTFFGRTVRYHRPTLSDGVGRGRRPQPAALPE